MSDSLLFDGDGGATGDCRAFSAGSLAASGALSLAFVVKPVGAFSGFDFLVNWNPDGSFNPSAGITLNGGVLTAWDGSSPDRTGPTLVTDEWWLIGYSKATGTVTPRYHTYRYSTTTHAHGNFSGTNANWTALSTIRLMHAAGEAFPGNLLIGAGWDSELSDAAFEALAVGGLQAWENAAPDEGWRFDTTGTITPFAGTSTQTDSQNETLDVGDAPAGWSDELSAFQAWVLSKSPLNYWRLGEPSGTNANDLGSGANDGTYVGTPTLGVAGGTPDPDTAVELNGSSQYVTTGTNVPANSTRTFMALVKLDNISSTRTLFGDQNDFKMSLSTSATLVGDILGGNWYEYALSIHGDSQFHAIVVVFNQTANTLSAWCDGALVGAESSVSPTTLGTNYRIGNNGASEYWDGVIDEFAVFGTAWVQADVDELEEALGEPEPPWEPEVDSQATLRTVQSGLRAR